MKPKSVVMIGGGIQEVEAVRIAQAMGLKVIVTDRNPKAPCFQYADVTVVIDGRDVESLIAFALLNKERLEIAGIFTLTELVTSVSAVSLGAGMPGVPLRSAVACQNKLLCKKIWNRKGIPTPEGGVVNSYEEAKRMFDRVGGKAFIKPLTGFGAEGARRIGAVSEFEGFYTAENLKFGSNSIMMEELANGTMHDVNGLITKDGVFHPLGIVDRYFLEDWPVEHEIQTPSVLTKNQQRNLYDLLEKGVRALGIHFGPVKGDAVLTDSGFKLLEVAPRLHGPKNSLYVLPMSGYEPLAPTLRVLTDQQIPTNELTIYQNRCCVCRALLPPPGRIHRLDGVKEALQLPGIEYVILFVSKGSVVTPYRNSTHVPGYIFATGDSFETCDKNLEQAFSTIRIEMETLQ